MTDDRQVFGPGDKLTWIEQIARDHGCTGFDVRVAVELSRHTNTKTGEATVSQTTIAHCLGKSDRWVRQSLKNLRERGHGEVIIWAKHGPGRPSTFRPLIRPRSPSDTGTILPVEQRNDPSGNGPEHRNNPSAIDAEHRKDCAATPEGLCSNTGSYASAHISNTKIPTEIPHARARGVDAAWMAVRKRLADDVGSEVFGAWFGKVALAGIESGVVTLQTPSKFASTYLEKHFHSLILLAWQAHEPDVVAVRFDHRIDPAAASERHEAARWLNASVDAGGAAEGAGDGNRSSWQSRRDAKHDALAELRASNEARRHSAAEDQAGENVDVTPRVVGES